MEGCGSPPYRKGNRKSFYAVKPGLDARKRMQWEGKGEGGAHMDKGGIKRGAREKASLLQAHIRPDT